MGENGVRSMVASATGKILAQHGFGLQYAVIAEAVRVFQIQSSFWRFDVAEFPISASGRDGRIDFVLRHAQHPVYLVGECKRVKSMDWVFFRAPSAKYRGSPERFLLDQVDPQPYGEGYVKGVARDEPSSGHFVDLGFAVNRGRRDGEARKEGDAEPEKQTAHAKSAIDDALTQVCVSANGLITHVIGERRQPGQIQSQFRILPVVVTNAPLWLCSADLAAGDTSTGNVKVTPTEVSEVAWVFYQYPVSRGIGGHERLLSEDPSLPTALDTVLRRTVTIVSTKHWPDALSALGLWAQ